MKLNQKRKEENINLDVPQTAFKPKEHLSKIDSSTKWTIIIFSAVILLILLFLVGFILYKSIPIFRHVGFFQFIFTAGWKPGADDDASAHYGILGTIGSTLMLLILALLFAVPLTIFGSLCICEYLRPRAKKVVINLIQLMAGIPSVVFGLFALDQIGSIMVLCGAKTPQNMMTAAITLAFMALPTMMALTIDAIESVPDGYRFASLGLGVTKEKTTFHVIFKTAIPKIITAIIMGIARIIGETMAVIMIAGGSAKGLDAKNGSNGFFFSSIATLAGTIGIEMLENSGPLHESALYAIGFVLFFIVIIINLFILGISRQRRIKKMRFHRTTNEVESKKQKGYRYTNYQLKALVRNYTEKRFWQTVESVILKFFLYSSLLIIVGFISWILVTIVIKGIVGFSWGSLITISGNKSGILATLVVTVLLVIATLTFAIPLSLIVAIYLAEYASPKSFVTKAIRFAINIMSSTPSIVFGVFGLALFITIMHIPISVFASSLTMTLVVLPSMIIVFEDSMNAVPPTYREAAYGMGLGRTATLWKIIIPSALKGMVTGIILTIARIFGESAPIYLTLGTAVRMPTAGYLSSGSTMTTEIYVLVSEGSSPKALDDAYMIAFITMLIIVLLNLVSMSLSKRLTPGFKKTTWLERKNKLKIIFGKENMKQVTNYTKYFFVNIGKKTKALFNFKKMHLYLKRHRNINNQIKMIKKEARKHDGSKARIAK